MITWCHGTRIDMVVTSHARVLPCMGRAGNRKHQPA